LSPRPASKKVFLVHGRDTGALESVEAFLRKLSLAVTILKDEPNKGQTIIEKVESNADVGFAVVLLTGDDEGRQRRVADTLLPRARQNAIFELGYFIGLLGRSRSVRKRSRASLGLLRSHFHSLVRRCALEAPTAS
jgi:predicted nucleotide-binding protein